MNDLAARTIAAHGGLDERATSGERIVLLSPWPESIFAFAPVWDGLMRQFQLLAIDLPGFGRSEGRDDLFTPQTMGDFIVNAIDAFGVRSAHAIGLDVGTPSLLAVRSVHEYLTFDRH